MFVKAPFQTESQILLFGEGFPIETDWMGEVGIGQHWTAATFNDEKRGSGINPSSTLLE